MEMPIDNAPSIDELVNTILEQSKIIAALEIAVKNLTASNKQSTPCCSECGSKLIQREPYCPNILCKF